MSIAGILDPTTAGGITLDDSPPSATGAPVRPPAVAISILTDANGRATATTKVSLTGIIQGNPVATWSTSTTLISVKVGPTTSDTTTTPSSTAPAPAAFEGQNIPMGASIFLLVVLPMLIGLALLTGLGVCLYRRRRKAKRQASRLALGGLSSGDGPRVQRRARLRELTEIIRPPRVVSRRAMQHPWEGLEVDKHQIPSLPELYGDPSTRSKTMLTEKRPVKVSEVSELEKGELSERPSKDKLNLG